MVTENQEKSQSKITLESSCNKNLIKQSDVEKLIDILSTKADNQPKASIRDDLKFAYFSGLKDKEIRKGYKPLTDKKCSKAFSAYTRATNFSGSINQIINEVKSGKAIAGKHYKNGYCDNDHVIDKSIDFFIADVDNTKLVDNPNYDPNNPNSKKKIKEYDPKLPLSDALEHPLLKDYGIIYTSPSHTSEWSRYRIIFVLPQTTSKITLPVLFEFFNSQLNYALDTACNNDKAFFYGNTKAEVYGLETAKRLPYEFLSKIEEIAEAREAEKEAQKAKAREKRQANDLDTSELSSLKEKAIALIPEIPERVKGSGTYDLMRNGIWGLCAMFKDDLDYLIELLEDSQACSNRSTGWDIPTLVNSYDPEREGTEGHKITAFSFFKCLDELIGSDYSKEVYKEFFKGKNNDSNYDVKAWLKQFKGRKLAELTSYTPDENRTFCAEFIGDKLISCLIEIKNKIICVKSPKGTGKTYLIGLLKKKYPDKHILLFTHRQALSSHIADDLKFLYLDPQVSIVYGEQWLENEDGATLVIDSIMKTQDINYSDIIVVIDEAEQVLNALLTSSTHIEKVRGKAMALLAEKIPQTYATILFDADLSDRTCNYFHGISGNKELVKFENSYKSPIKRIVVKTKNLENAINAIEKALKNNERVIVACDDTTILRALKERFEKEFKTVLLTAKNLIDNPKLHRFFENKGKAIVDEEIQLLLYSPVAQSGISWELDEKINDEIVSYFNLAVGLFTGVIDPYDARQMLRRYRGYCDMVVYAPQHGKNYANQFDWKEIKNTSEHLKAECMDATDYVTYIDKCCEGDDNLRVKVANLIAKPDNNKTYKHNMDHKAMLIARYNLLMSDYSEILFNGLINEGCELFDELLDDLSDNTTNNSIEGIKEEILIQDAKDVQKAREIDENESKKLSKQRNLRKHDRDALNRYILTQAVKCSELLEGDSGVLFILQYFIKNKLKIVKGIKNLVIARDKELSKVLDKKAMNYQLSHALESGIFWHDDIESYSLLNKIYEKLSLFEIIRHNPKGNIPITENVTMCRDEQELFIKRCNEIKKLLLAFGICVTKRSKFKRVFDAVLALFGYKSECEKKTKHERFYKPVPIIPNFKDEKLDPNFGFECWDKIYFAIQSDFELHINTLSELENPLKNILIQKSEEKMAKNYTKSESQAVAIVNCEYKQQLSIATSQKVNTARDTGVILLQKTTNTDSIVKVVTDKQVNIMLNVTENEAKTKSNWIGKLIKYDDKLHYVESENGDLLLIKEDNNYDLIEVSKKDVTIIERGTKCYYVDKLGDWIEGVIYTIANYGVQCMSKASDMLWCGFNQVQLI